MIKLYGVPASRTARSLWMLAELGVEYKNIPVHWAKEAKEAPFLALNPNGKIPVLVDDDGTVLYEAMAINLYLAEKYGKGTLWPDSQADRGRCYQWSLWVMTEVEPHGTNVVLNRNRPPEECDERIAKAEEAALQKRLQILDTALEGRDYLLDCGFCVADLNVCSVVYILETLGRVDFSGFPNLTAWIRRCVTRPAHVKLWSS